MRKNMMVLILLCGQVWSAMSLGIHLKISTKGEDKTVVPVAFGFSKSLGYTITDCEYKQWVLEDERAGGVNVVFNNINTPGAKVVVSDLDEIRQQYYTDEADGVETKYIRGSGVIVTYMPEEECDASADDFGVKIDRVVFHYSADYLAPKQMVCGEDDRVNAVCLIEDDKFTAEAEASVFKGIFELSRAVVRILLLSENGLWIPCTGWLYDDDYVVTAHHCIMDQAAADTARIMFGCDEVVCNSTNDVWDRVPCEDEVVGSRLISTSFEHDYSVLALHDDTGGNWTSKYGALEVSRSKPKLNERIAVIQHPSGLGKKIAISDDQNGESTESLITRLKEEEVYYTADTEGGSSGAPVIGLESMQVIGIHYTSADSGCENVAHATSAFWKDVQASIEKDKGMLG